MSRTLRQDTQRRLPKLYAQASELALLALTEFGERVAAERLPSECRYTLVQILEDGWYPDPVEKP